MEIPTNKIQRGFLGNTAKMIGVGFLMLILWLSSFFVSSLVSERMNRQQEVHQEIADKWGAPQLVAGPVLSLPFTRVTRDANNVAQVTRETIYLLPENLNVTAKVNPQEKKRGIFSSTVYTADVEMVADFDLASLSELTSRPADSAISWNDANLSLSLADTRGIVEPANFDWANKQVAWRSGSLLSLGVPDESGLAKGRYYPSMDYPYTDGPIRYDNGQAVTGSGLHSAVTVTPNGPPGGEAGKYHFNFKFSVQGSRVLEFLPFGKNSNIAVNSSWPSPSFIGSLLPSESKLGTDGFTAKWQVSSLSRPYANVWEKGGVDISTLKQSALGVNLLTSVDFYTLVDRTTKYAILFIALTFLAFFLFEVISKIRIHPMQYILIGIALVLFYLLLLSFAENIGFMWAYILATIMTVGLVWNYSRFVLKTGNRANLIAAMLIALYVYLYIILQLEELALLFGSVLLFLVLAIVMRVTRKIEWYSQVE
ncbi:MAG TPA: cell envelope integrity protein CreD [Candidatus Paceibacterota bacterium]